ncbi:MAG: von Willebrand factor type A domain-containing protein, partial [Lachnospiraceae bacterium]|nr:von Willebrand factor type A domain-containing protein [Lachnospiraceae bacterium]
MSAAASTSSAHASASNANGISSVPPAYWGTGGYRSYDFDDAGAGFNTEEYSALMENVFKDVSTSPLSTFSADVDTASYANIRRMIYSGREPEYIPTGAARIEEMVNYFTYNYSGPKNGEPFGINAEISDCPWNKDHKLVRIGLQTEAIDFSKS